MIFNKAKRTEAARVKEESKMGAGNDMYLQPNDPYANDSKFPIRFGREDIAVIASPLIHGLFSLRDVKGGGEAFSSGDSGNLNTFREVEASGQEIGCGEVFCEGQVEVSPPLYAGQVERSSDNARLRFRATMKIGQKEGKNNSGKGGESGSEDGVSH